MPQCDRDGLVVDKTDDLPQRERIMTSKARHLSIVMIAIIALVLFFPPYCLSDETVLTVSVQKAHAIIKKSTHDSDFVILDIRTPGEFKAGHLQNSILIDYYAATFVQQLEKLDKYRTYLVYCRSGNRSGKALPLFRKMAFKKVYEMGRGINGWRAAGLPVVQ